MRIKAVGHTESPWRVHAFVEDFELLDVWRMPVEGEPHESLADYERTVSEVEAQLLTSGPAGWLFRLRLWLGRALGWDETPERLTIPGTGHGSLRDRLPEALRGTVEDAEPASGTDFTEVYRLPDETAREISNKTVHALMHTAKVPLGEGRWGVEMAVYCKARGWKGRAYMALIDPFRHFVVYPALMRLVGRAWARRVR